MKIDSLPPKPIINRNVKENLEAAKSVQNWPDEKSMFSEILALRSGKKQV